jgi:menaquinone-dependent protoporphyrinogen oxidase
VAHQHPRREAAMRFLIVYATTEGQTRKIVEFIAARLTTFPDAVRLVDAAAVPPDLDLSAFDTAILAASVHASRYQTTIEAFARTHAARLNAMPTAFISVSLAASGHDANDWKGLATCVADLQRRTGWTPTAVHHVAGAFRYTQYNFVTRWTMRYIAWWKGGPTDTSRDHELTDWKAVEALAAQVSQRAA